MKNSLFDALCFNTLKKQFLIFLAACTLFITAVYTPVYLLLDSNVIWRQSILLYLWTELLEPLMNLVFYWGAFSYVLYVCIRFSTKEAKPFFLFYGIAVFARYLLPMLVTFAMMSFPGWTHLWSYELKGLIISLLLDGLQMAAVVLLCEFFFKHSRTFEGSGKTGAQMLDESLPVTRMFSLHSPLPKLCLLCAAVPAVLRILSRLYYDIFFYGFPGRAAEWLLVITYYLGDIACFLIGCFVLQLILQALYTEETKRKINFES